MSADTQPTPPASDPVLIAIAEHANKKTWSLNQYEAAEDFVRAIRAGDGEKYEEKYPGLSLKKTEKVRKLFTKHNVATVT